MAETTKVPYELDRLACPVCRAALRADADAIVCTECSRRYPVIDGIPVLIADRPS